MSNVRVVSAVLLLALGCKDDATTGKDERGFRQSKRDLAILGAKKLAFEAYPQWAAGHPDKACPDKLENLLEYVPAKSDKDAWGNTYRMFCGPSLPPGARGLAITSPGEDGKDGTADDIKSWE